MKRDLRKVGIYIAAAAANLRDLPFPVKERKISQECIQCNGTGRETNRRSAKGLDPFMKPPPTRVALPVLLLIASMLCFVLLQAQTASTPAPDAAPSQPPASSSSTILNPAISNLQAALDGIRVERWKASSPIRDEAQTNIDSVRRDLEETLPPLLTAADAAPNSVPQVLPVYRNIEALYDVLLRISAAARLTAPPQQSAALDQAMSNLEASRRTLGDQLQAAAVNQDRKILDLQASLRTPAPVPAAAPCSPAPAAAKKRKTPAKVVPKPVPPADPANPNAPQQ